MFKYNYILIYNWSLEIFNMLHVCKAWISICVRSMIWKYFFLLYIYKKTFGLRLCYRCIQTDFSLKGTTQRWHIPGAIILFWKDAGGSWIIGKKTEERTRTHTGLDNWKRTEEHTHARALLFVYILFFFYLWNCEKSKEMFWIVWG